MSDGTPHDPHGPPPEGESSPYVPPGGAPAEPQEHPENRPVGVTILAVLYGIAAALFVFGGLAMLLAALGAIPAPAADVTGYGILAGALMIVLGGLAVGIAYGLWNRYKWAWSAAFFVSALAVVVNLVGIFVGAPLSSILGVLVHGAILWYLSQPVVKTWFGATGQGPRVRGRPT